MITQRILSLLEEKSLTATDLCRAIGINTSTMTNWKTRGTDAPSKTGKRNSSGISPKTGSNIIIPICEFLGVSSDYLLTGKERNSKQNILSEDSEWLALIHQLPHDAQLEFRGELKGYIKCLKRQEEDTVEPLKKAK